MKFLLEQNRMYQAIADPYLFFGISYICIFMIYYTITILNVRQTRSIR